MLERIIGIILGIGFSFIVFKAIEAAVCLVRG